jgi:hypothetical protein
MREGSIEIDPAASRRIDSPEFRVRLTAVIGIGPVNLDRRQDVG